MTAAMYTVALGLLLLSFIKSREKTKLALKKAWKSFENILPLILAILFAIGIILSVLKPEIISKAIGADSGFAGILLAAVIGSSTVIPGFVLFPLAGSLLHNGAGLIPVAALISTSVMVGILTLPIEVKYFGKRTAYVRNVLALVCSLLIAFAMGGLIN